jgi:peptide/nickel transport system permease protein
LAGYVVKRLLQAVPVLLGVTLVTYLLIFAVPGDQARLALGIRSDVETAESFRQEWGLEDPWYVQYGRFLWRVSHGDLGRSMATNEKVLDSLLHRLPATAELGLAALLLAVLVGVPVGVISAVRPYSKLDDALMSLSLLGVSMPTFFLGILLAWTFGYILGWTPISGYQEGWSGVKYLILPAAALGTAPLAIIARLTRSSMLEVMGQDYLTTARAKGLLERAVILKHALKNAMIPVVTAIGGSMAALLSGTFFIEYIFGWPGVGLLAVDAITSYDLTMIQGTVMFAALVFVIVNIMVDIIYAFLDPRITY